MCFQNRKSRKIANGKLQIANRISLFFALLVFFLCGCQRSAPSPDIPAVRAMADNLRIQGNRVIFTDFPTAQKLFRQGLDLCAPVLPKSDTLVLRLYHNLGSAYFNEKKYDLALAFFDSVQAYQPKDPIMWLQAHNDFKIGKCYVNLEDFALAKPYLQNAIRNAPDYPQSRSILPFAFLEYAQCLLGEQRFNKDFSEAIAVSQQAIASCFMSSVRTREDSLTYGHTLFGMSTVLTNASNTTEAIRYIKKALDIYKAIGYEPDIASATINLSYYYRITHQYQAEEQLINQRLSLMEISKEDSRRLIGGLYTQRADLRMDQNRPKEALLDYDTAISYLTRNVHVNSPQGGLTDLETQPDIRPHLLDDLKGAALARIQLLGLGDSTQKPLISATYDAIIQLTGMIRRDYLSEDAKINLSAEVKPILEQAFAVARSLPNGSEQAFMISEQSKSMALLEALRLNNRELSNARNPRQINEAKTRLAALKTERTEIEKKISDTPPNSAQASSLNADLTQNIANERNQRLLFNAAAGVQNANDTLVSLANIRDNLLEPDQALLEYLIQGDSILNIFCLSPHDPLVLETVALPKNFRTLLDSLTAAASTPDGFRQKSVCENAFKLYQLLIAPIVRVKKLPHRLIIVAEQPLSNLPFDLLLPQPAQDYAKAVADQLPLVFNYALSYSYSANLLWEMRFVNKTNGQKGIAAFAPAFPQKMNPDMAYMNLPLQKSYPFLTNLPNIREIQNIGNRTHLYLGDQATKQAFKEACRQNNVLHIATHSIVNYANPDFNYISFSQNRDVLDRDQLFYLKDMYANPIHLDLAVFSACQSAIGKEIKGEAPLSMARGLAYAGVRSFITTQWLVNTDKNADFYPSFYDAIAKGVPKDIALQQAKQHFINQADGNNDPYFWANTILIGNTQPIDFLSDSSHTRWYLFDALAAAFAAFFFFRKKQVKTKGNSLNN